MNRQQRIIELAEELSAILTLEFHNKNHLNHGTNPALLNEDKKAIVAAIKAEAQLLD